MRLTFATSAIVLLIAVAIGVFLKHSAREQVPGVIGGLWSAEISPDCRAVAFAFNRGGVVVAESDLRGTAKGAVHTSRLLTPSAYAATFSADGSRLAAVLSDSRGGRRLAVVDRITSQLVSSLAVDATSIAFCGDADSVLLGCSDGTIVRYCVGQSKTFAVIQAHEGEVELVAADAECGRIASVAGGEFAVHTGDGGVICRVGLREQDSRSLVEVGAGKWLFCQESGAVVVDIDPLMHRPVELPERATPERAVVASDLSKVAILSRRYDAKARVVVSLHSVEDMSASSMTEYNGEWVCDFGRCSSGELAVVLREADGVFRCLLVDWQGTVIGERRLELRAEKRKYVDRHSTVWGRLRKSLL